MKKFAIAVTGMLAVITAQALVVTLDDVVLGYHNDLTRYDYLGQAGELVRNSQNEGLTIFDGVTTGGVSIVRSLDVYNSSPRKSGQDNLENGERLRAAILRANAIVATRETTYFADPVRVLIDTGEYTITGGVDIALNVALEARVIDEGMGRGRYYHRSGGEKDTLNRPNPLVIIKADDTGTNEVFRFYQEYVSAFNGITLEGVAIDSPIEVDFTRISDHRVQTHIRSCQIQDLGATPKSSTTGETHAMQISAFDSVFYGEIGTDYGSTETYWMEAFNCRFTSTASFWGQRCTAAYDAQEYPDAKFEFCRIDNPNFFGAQVGGNIIATPTMVNCDINGNGFLSAFDAVDSSYCHFEPFYNCRFHDTAGTWGGTLLQATRNKMVFHGCTGVSSNFVAGTMSVTFCTDENGNAITNQ